MLYCLLTRNNKNCQLIREMPKYEHGKRKYWVKRHNNKFGTSAVCTTIGFFCRFSIYRSANWYMEVLGHADYGFAIHFTIWGMYEQLIPEWCQLYQDQKIYQRNEYYNKKNNVSQCNYVNNQQQTNFRISSAPLANSTHCQ